jgi:hypothetical protein
MDQDLSGDGASGPEGGAEIAAQGGACPDQVLLHDGPVEADAAVELRHALGGDLRVGPEHDRHRIARDEADHQEHDDRDAEEHDDQIDQAREQDAVHGVKGFASRKTPTPQAGGAGAMMSAQKLAPRRVESERFGMTS